MPRDILSLRQGEHLCLIYDNDPAEQLPVILPFLRQGLENGEQCIYVADDFAVEDFRRALEEYGVDLALEEERGALQVWTRAQWRPEQLDSATKEAEVRSVIENALRLGFTGIRFGVEMTWTTGPEVDVQRLAHWEATINRIFTPDVPARIICQYSRRKLSGAAILAGLRTHPTAVLGRDVCPNAYYEAPFILHGSGASESERAAWMVAQLRWARTLEDERAQRLRSEAALAQAETMSRERDMFLATLAHQLRSPVASLCSAVEALREGPDAGRKDKILEDIAEQARQLSGVVEDLLRRPWAD